MHVVSSLEISAKQASIVSKKQFQIRLLSSSSLKLIV